MAVSNASFGRDDSSREREITRGTKEKKAHVMAIEEGEPQRSMRIQLQNIHNAALAIR
jgi:hypothetical protein